MLLPERNHCLLYTRHTSNLTETVYQSAVSLLRSRTGYLSWKVQDTDVEYAE